MVGTCRSGGSRRLLGGTMVLLVVAWHGVASAEVDGFRPYADQFVDRLAVGTK
jgi:hypothetical protein